MSCRGVEQVREAGRRKITPFLLENDSEKILEQSQSAVVDSTRLNQAKKLVLHGTARTIALSRIEQTQ